MSREDNLVSHAHGTKRVSPPPIIGTPPKNTGDYYQVVPINPPRDSAESSRNRPSSLQEISSFVDERTDNQEGVPEIAGDTPERFSSGIRPPSDTNNLVGSQKSMGVTISATPEEPNSPSWGNLRRVQSFVGSASDSGNATKKIIGCLASTALALIVGIEFGLLSIKGESGSEWWKAFRFTSSAAVNFAGSLIAIQDIFSLILKLKDTQNPDYPALKRAFTAAFFLTTFAVISTIPLANDSVSDKNGNLSWYGYAGVAAWCGGYVAPTRQEGGTGLIKLIAELFSKRNQNSIDSKDNAGLTRAAQFFLIAGSLFMSPILAFEADRGWGELHVKSPVARYFLDAPSTLAALIFFVRSAQLLPERLIGSAKEVYSQVVGSEKGVAFRLISASIIPVMLGVAFGSCFGWLYEAKEFSQNNQTPFAKATFSGYEYIVAFYGALANLGFLLNLFNKCSSFSKEKDVSFGRALAHRLTGLTVFATRQSPDVVNASSSLLANAQKV